MEKQGINVDLIKSYINDNNHTKKSFCKKCGISIQTLNKILENRDDINIISLFKVVRAMDLNMYQIFVN